MARAESEDGVRALVEAGVDDLVRPELEGGIELMRHTLLDLGYRPRQIMEWANELRASGYEALGDDARMERRQAAEHLMASFSEIDLSWVEVGNGCSAAGCTLGALDLRAATGANAVAVRRAGDLVFFVDATTAIESGDKLGLMGTPDQIDAARALLGSA